MSTLVAQCETWLGVLFICRVALCRTFSCYSPSLRPHSAATALSSISLHHTNTFSATAQHDNTSTTSHHNTHTLLTLILLLLLRAGELAPRRVAPLGYAARQRGGHRVPLHPLRRHLHAPLARAVPRAYRGARRAAAAALVALPARHLQLAHRPEPARARDHRCAPGLLPLSLARLFERSRASPRASSPVSSRTCLRVELVFVVAAQHVIPPAAPSLLLQASARL